MSKVRIQKCLVALCSLGLRIPLRLRLARNSEGSKMGESGGTGGAFVLSERATHPNPGDLPPIVLVPVRCETPLSDPPAESVHPGIRHGRCIA